MSSQPSSRPPSSSLSRWGRLHSLEGSWTLADPGGPVSSSLTTALAFVAAVTAALHVPALGAWLPGVDLDIPLQAAARWAAGGQPYLASSFAVRWGPGLPFLYPPWVLPPLVPLAGLPRQPVLDAWLVLTVAIAVWACRRLSIPWYGVPFVLAWPPFAEGLVTGNVQILQFAAFAALFYVPGSSWSPRPRSLEPGHDVSNGLLAAGVGALKYTQLVPLVFLVRHRPRAALAGILALAGVALVFLALTGPGLYGNWFGQLGRASNPGWALLGSPLSSFVGRPMALLAAALAVFGMLFVSGPDAGAWVGIALLVAAPSVHGYALLFLLPALLIIRRDLALLLTLAIATYDPRLWWISIGVAAAVLAASTWVPNLRQPIPGPRRAGRRRGGLKVERPEEDEGAAAA